MNEIHFNSIDSTNKYAKTHAHEFPKDQITCITAEEQTDGHGRFQSRWTSPPGVNLYVTFYLQFPSNTPQITCLALLLALSLAQILEEEGLHPEIKWPNDLQLHGKKLSGILCETSFQGEKVDLFLGMGINVNMLLKDLNFIDQPATSLLVETGKSWDRTKLLLQLKIRISKDLDTFQKKGFMPFHKKFESYLAYKGQQVRCFDGKQEWVGICHSLSPNGELNLLLPNQTLHPFRCGEIHLRPI